jgi:hypothetical protein
MFPFNHKPAAVPQPEVEEPQPVPEGKVTEDAADEKALDTLT